MNNIDPSLSVNSRVTVAIENASAKTDVDFGYLFGQAQSESGMRHDAPARTSPACRAAVARLLRAQLSDAAVLSFLEIPENRSVDVIAAVGAATPREPLAFENGDTDVQ